MELKFLIFLILFLTGGFYDASKNEPVRLSSSVYGYCDAQAPQEHYANADQGRL